MNPIQIAIICTGVVAVFLSQSADPKRRRYACLFGIVGQPFWFIATYEAAQWGMFAAALLYTYGWTLGLWNNWLKPYRQRFL